MSGTPGLLFADYLPFYACRQETLLFKFPFIPSKQSSRWIYRSHNVVGFCIKVVEEMASTAFSWLLLNLVHMINTKCQCSWHYLGSLVHNLHNYLPLDIPVFCGGYLIISSDDLVFCRIIKSTGKNVSFFISSYLLLQGTLCVTCLPHLHFAICVCLLKQWVCITIKIVGCYAGQMLS